MSHFQLHEVYKPPESSKIIQSHLCCLLDTTSTRPASTSAAASDVTCPDVEAVPVSPCLCTPRGLKTFTHKSTALPRLCLPNALLPFTRKSTRDVLASAPLTFTRKSTALPRLCFSIVTLQFHSQVTTNVLSKCTPKNVLSKCTVKLVLLASSLLTSSHSGQACHCGAVS